MHITWPYRRQALSKFPWLVCILLPAVLWVPPGCDDPESSTARSARLQAEELARQLEQERVSHQRDLSVVHLEKEVTREDVHAVNIILVSCGVTIVMLILLLARERRCRRVVERLVRLLLDRIQGSRIAP